MTDLNDQQLDAADASPTADADELPDTPGFDQATALDGDDVEAMHVEVIGDESAAYELAAD